MFLNSSSHSSQLILKPEEAFKAITSAAKYCLAFGHTSRNVLLIALFEVISEDKVAISRVGDVTDRVNEPMCVKRVKLFVDKLAKPQTKQSSISSLPCF